MGSRAGGIAVVVVLVVIAWFAFLRPGGTYTVHAEFTDASQLVNGDLVTVGGLQIGKIKKLKLTEDGLADAVLSINKGSFTPLHAGTTARITSVGLASITNRFIDLSPGPSNAPEIPDGGVLAVTQTQPLVDLDTLLNSLTPKVRASLQGIIRDGADIFAPPTPHNLNQAGLYLNPAFSRVAALVGQMMADKAAFRSLIHTGATVASTLAARRADLAQGVESAANALGQVASERGALQDLLVRAPAVLTQAGGTLKRLRATLAVLRPTLTEAKPSAAPLARVLRALVPTARHATPVVASLRRLLPSLKTSLDGLPSLYDASKPVLVPTANMLAQLLPVATGLRPYAPDAISGVITGLAGSAAANYDANGHFARIVPLAGVGSATGGVLASTLATLGAALPTLGGYETGKVARCPGGAVAPAPDGSNPYIPDASLCNPGDDVH
jgi:phospholipid/cholesterol/gamma-HCH transport system substrate-binding protein